MKTENDPLLAALWRMEPGDELRVTFKPETDEEVVHGLKSLHEVSFSIPGRDISAMLDYATDRRRQAKSLTVTMKLLAGATDRKALRVKFGDAVQEFHVISAE